MSKDEKRCIDIDQQQSKPEGLWTRPVGPAQFTIVLAHGAGAPMDSAFMQRIAELLAEQGVAVFRFEFAYMAARRIDGKKRPPNPQAQLLEQWRRVWAQLRADVDGPLVMAGKSMGGRMASLLADELGADGLLCLGYPFYPAGKPEKPRVAHLAALKTPTLIVQGERDALGNRQTVSTYELSPAIELLWLAAADHDLKPLKSSGFTREQYLQKAAQAVAQFFSARP